MTALVLVLRTGSAIALFGGVFSLGWWCCWLSGAVAGKTGTVDRA